MAKLNRAGKRKRSLRSQLAFWSPPVLYGALIVALFVDVYDISIVGTLPSLDLSYFDQLSIPWISTGIPFTVQIPFPAWIADTWAFLASGGEGEISGAVGGPIFLAIFSLATGFIAMWPLLLLSNRLVTPRRAVVAMILAIPGVIVAYTLIYQLGGLLVGAKSETEHDFTQALYMSMTMMSSLGFGDITGSQQVRMYIATQAIFGFFMMGAALGLTVTILSDGSRNRSDRLG